MLCKVIFAISDFLVFIKNISVDPSTTTEWTLSIQRNCSTVCGNPCSKRAQLLKCNKLQKSKVKADIRVDPEEVATLVAEVRFTSSWYSLWRASEGGQP